jgi:hypothetical protein
MIDLTTAFIPLLTIEGGNIEKCMTAICDWRDAKGRRFRQTWYTDGTTRVSALDASAAFTPAEVEAAKAHGSRLYQEKSADIEQVRRLARAMWIRTLPLYAAGETIGDYAARAGILPPKPGKRERWADDVLDAACERIALEYVP